MKTYQRILTDKTPFKSFLESEPNPKVVLILSELSKEIKESGKFPFFKEFVLMGSLQSGNWAVRASRESADKSDVDLAIITEFNPELSDSDIEEQVDQLDVLINDYFEKKGLTLCHLIRPSKCYLNINNLNKHFSQLRIDAEEFLVTEGSFEIEKIATVAAGIMSENYRDLVIQELERYFKDDSEGLMFVKKAINIFIDVMYKLRSKHLVEKPENSFPIDNPQVKRMAERLNTLKSKTGKRRIDSI